MDTIRNAANSVGNYFSHMKNMAAVESDDKGKDLVKTRELISNLKKQVVAEELWELPSKTQDDGASVKTVKEQGVVVALEDGQTKYLIRRIPNEQKEGVVDVVVTYASHMEPSGWVRVEEKEVKKAKLEDYLDQDEDSKHETEGKLGESEGKKESTDVNLVKSEDKGDSMESPCCQFEDKMDSSDSHKDSEDTASKM